MYQIDMKGVLAFVVVCERDDGTISTSGHIGDKALCLALLEQAADAIRGHLRAEIDGKKIITPNRDVDLVHSPAYPVYDYGDTQ